MRNYKTGPQQLRSGVCVLSRADSMRVDAFIQRVGLRPASKALGVGTFLLEAAREDGGRMQVKTRARLFDALDRLEASAS